MLTETQMRRLDKIVSDFVISWGPDPEILSEYGIPDIANERDMITLLYPESTDDAGIYLAISHLAERRQLSSQFLEEAGEDAWRVMARVFRRLCREQGSAPGSVSETLAARLLGKRRTVPARLFLWVPYEPQAREGDVVTVSPVTSYRLQEGKWYKDSFSVLRDEAALRELNATVRECERVLRIKMHYRNSLPDKLHDKALARLIGEEYDRWIEEKAVRDRPKIQVDLSKLRAIREQAAITRDRLLEGTQEGDLSEAMNAFVEESVWERAEPGAVSAGDADRRTESADREAESAEPADFPGTAAKIGNVPVQDGSREGSEDGIFHPEERAFLELLLAGKNGKDYFRENKVLPSVFIDAINEKAYDEIGDSIVEEGSSGWCLVDDYIEDVRVLLGR